MVRGMAGRTRHIRLCVERIDRMHLGRAGLVATQAALVDALRARRALPLEDEYLCLVHGVGDVLRPRAVAPLTALVRGAATRIERRFPMWGLFPI